MSRKTDGPRRPRYRKKNTKRWCRGKVGVDHKPTIIKSSWGHSAGMQCGDLTTGWQICWHEVVCGECGKYIGEVSPKDCPELQESDESDEGSR